MEYDPYREYPDVINLIRKNIPEIEPAYSDTLSWWDYRSGLTYHIIGHDLVHLVIAAIEREDHSDDFLTRVFDTVETIAQLSKGDAYLQEIISVGFCEPIIGERSTRIVARRYMGQSTAALSSENEQRSFYQGFDEADGVIESTGLEY